jgi:hypothetical protein
MATSNLRWVGSKTTATCRAGSPRAPTSSASCGGRSTTGELLGEVNTESAWGLPIEYFIAPSAVPTTVHALVGDYSLAVIGVRRDVTYKLLDQAAITDATGAIIYNLRQQDMQAMRVTARFGFQVGKPATRTGAANAYPFATLETAT